MKNRKKICFITQCSLPVPTTRGGAVETLVEYLISENEVNNDFNFTVVSIYDEKAEDISKKYKNTKFIYVKEKNNFFNSIYHFIYRVLKKISIYIPFTLEFKEVLRIIKEIKDDYDLFIYEAGPTTQLPLLNKYIPKEKLVAHLHWDGLSNMKKDKSFCYLFTVSNYIGRQWEKTASNKNGNIKVLRNCANTEVFCKKITEAEKNNLRKKFKIGKKDFVLIFTGRIIPEKGVLELLKAYENVKYDDVKLIVIGSSNFGNKVKTKYDAIIKNQIQIMKKAVIFTGFIHQTDLYKYYNIADLAIMPSMFQDPAPLVCIETQATGTPLIATNVGGISEYASSETILLEKNEDLIDNLTKNIEFLYLNREKLEEMSVKGKEHVKEYTKKNYYKNFKKLIGDIIK